MSNYLSRAVTFLQLFYGIKLYDLVLVSVPTTSKTHEETSKKRFCDNWIASK